MLLATEIAVALVALLHVFFLVLEMFLWTTPGGMKRFGMTPEQAALTAPLAKNQGLYNGFLAAGLVWGLVISDAAWAANVQIFFLACVIVAGLYGGLTTRRQILFVQAVPGVIALALRLASR